MVDLLSSNFEMFLHQSCGVSENLDLFTVVQELSSYGVGHYKMRI